MVKRSREDFDPVHNSTTTSSQAINSATSPPSICHESEQSEIKKFVYVDCEGADTLKPTEIMQCSLPPHRQTLSFASFQDYEVHYNKTHVNRCSECRKNFPTHHFLDLHISENHNPLVELLRERGERTYSCFVEDCDRKCSTPQKRRMHMIDKHLFPKEYDFDVVNDGIDQKSSMLKSGFRGKRSSTAQHETNIGRKKASTMENISSASMMLIDNTFDNDKIMQQDDTGAEAAVTPGTDTAIEGLTGAMSALKFVPPSVKFGRSKGRGGFSRS